VKLFCSFNIGVGNRVLFFRVIEVERTTICEILPHSLYVTQGDQSTAKQDEAA